MSVPLPRERRPGRLVAVGFGVFVLGRIIDLVWHLTHEGFETAVQQVQAHSVVWLGVVVMLVGAAWGVGARPRNLGYAIVLFGSVLYLGVAAWHFWEHARLRDPELPHVLLLTGTVILTVGVAWMTVSARLRARRRATAGPT